MNNLVVSFSADSGLNVGSFEKVKGAFLVTEGNGNMPTIKGHNSASAGYSASYQTSYNLSGQVVFTLKDPSPSFIGAFQKASSRGKNFNTLHIFEVATWNGGKDDKVFYVPKRQLTLYKVSIDLDLVGGASDEYSINATGQYAEQKYFEQDKDKPSFKVTDTMYIDCTTYKQLEKLDAAECKPKDAEELKSGSN